MVQNICLSRFLRTRKVIRLTPPLWPRRARYMPQNPCVIASKGPSDSVFVFDYTKVGQLILPQPYSPATLCSPAASLSRHLVLPSASSDWTAAPEHESTRRSCPDPPAIDGRTDGRTLPLGAAATRRGRNAPACAPIRQGPLHKHSSSSKAGQSL